MVIEYHMPLPAQFWDGYHHMQLCQHSFGMVIIICSSASTVLEFQEKSKQLQCSSASTVLGWFPKLTVLYFKIAESREDQEKI